MRNENNIPENTKTSVEQSGLGEFVTPHSQTRKCRRQSNVENTDKSNQLLSDAVSILKTTAGKLQTPKSTENSEVQAFCSYLSTKMSTYTPVIQKRLQHSIFNLLIEADCSLEQFSSPAVHNVSHSTHSHFPHFSSSQVATHHPSDSSSFSQGGSTTLTPLQPLHFPSSSNTQQQLSTVDSPSPNSNPVSPYEIQTSPYNYSSSMISPAGSIITQYSDDIGDFV